ncbi:MAG TPA: MotA/TolQ/ExbB proton channel family protein [Lacunisphaera sp.]
MNLRIAFVFTALIAASAIGADTFEESAAKAAVEYADRLKKASAELTAVRAKIADEKAPKLKALHAAEERIVAAEADIARIDTGQENSQGRRRELQKERDAVLKNLSYVSTLAHDAAVAARDGLTAGEDQIAGEELDRIIRQFDEVPKVTPEKAATDALDVIVGRIERSLGGYRAPGKAILANTSELVEGTYAFTGPDAFFSTQDGKLFGIARSREGTLFPMLHVLRDWKPADAEAFFQGRPGRMMADTTGGKALRLVETKGTVWEHIRRGGVVSFAILFVGLLAFGLILNKAYDLVKLQVDDPEKVDALLKKLHQRPGIGSTEMLRSLGSATRDLFATGFEHMREPKQQLEERMWAVLMRIRLHYERRLPLLAVIAVAAPLMGLLGTVTGMVKTFALITVFGTGNAGKLASGISEVLVATELGLMVAIPSLVAHGFLANRIQKKLSLLERYALEFSTAAQARLAAAKDLVEVS